MEPMLRTAGPRRCAARNAAAAFTLIELLTVIAIIALLTAILLPVFVAVKENARRAACMSNLREIGAAVRQYELDNRKYPEYLLGPSLNSDGTVNNTGSGAISPEQMSGLVRATINSATPPAQIAAVQNAQYAYGRALYPTYVKELATFHCPNDSDNDVVTRTDTAVVQRFEKWDSSNPYHPASPTIPPSTAQLNVGYYKYDSYDSNPRITTSGNGYKLDFNNYQCRYERVWVPLVPRKSSGSIVGLDSMPTAQLNAYKQQLVFNNPSTDTIISMCTHHVPKGKIIVLWLSGTAKVLDTEKLNKAPFNAPQYGRDAEFNALTPTNY